MKKISFGLSLNRITRMRNATQEYITLSEKFSKKKKEKVLTFEKQLISMQRQLQLHLVFKSILLLMLYAGVLSAIFQGTIFEDAVSIAYFAGNIIGSTLVFIAYASLSRLSNIVVSDAHVVTAALISMVENEMKKKK